MHALMASLIAPLSATECHRSNLASSKAMLAAADRRVFLPMYGFTESFNVSVAAALVLQRLLDAAHESRGQLPAAELAALRLQWYTELARSDEQLRTFLELARAGGAAPFADTRRPEAHRAEQRADGLRKASFQCE
jgi:hypothetical protein